MALFAKLRDRLLGKKPITGAYRHAATASASMRIDQLPAFSLNVAELMRFDPQVRIGLGARNGLLTAARVDVVAQRDDLRQWVQTQWDRIWASSAQQLLRAKLYGFVPFEVMYRQAVGGPFVGAVEFDHLRDRHPRDTRLLACDGQVAGFLLKNEKARPITLLAPKALVCSFDAEFGNPYGRSLLERAYPPWHEKWMEGGAKKTLRLRMIKDAYIGDIFWYPPDKKVELPDGQTVSWRDVAREMLEARLSGGAMTLPLLRDRDGNRLMEYTPPQDVGGATHIFEWKRDVDLEIWKALEVPPEIIEAGGTGSGYSGRSIPFVVALAAVQTELAEIVRAVDRDVLRPLAHLNFGTEPQYDIRPRSLIDVYSRQDNLRRESPDPILGLPDTC